MKEKVVIFGGSGFLGSHVADYLTDLGYRVIIFDLIGSEYLTKDQEMVVGDVLDKKLVNSTIKGAKYVYHFAAIADIKEAQEKPIKSIEVNIMSTAYILDACVKYNVKRLIFGSTIYVYSNYGSFYRSSKQASELIIQNYHEIYKLNYTILRYGSLYGPRANNFNLINRVIIQALKERKVVREGTGEELREYIHIKDAAKASVSILSSEFLNSNILITGSRAMRIQDFFIMLKEIFDNKIAIEYSKKDLLDKHYNITPYVFKPQVATRYMLNNYYDLGQGILDQIHNIYEELLNAGEIDSDNPFTNFNNNE